ncbi:hypothetical protein I7I53_11974 [Histoplasma capsulatum var. duboisii H88]|uniref:Uncharacterized protein n=1 Tax=Ajellomyces capsulatus (strain H88) TaxID=544711 RepID=A0A8A1LYU8_AJEC8|nr:hypothetical protein I7I53_11974 [Histoplasma capsulatum var. duboisii H88]
MPGQHRLAESPLIISERAAGRSLLSGACRNFKAIPTTEDQDGKFCEFWNDHETSFMSTQKKTNIWRRFSTIFISSFFHFPTLLLLYILFDIALGVFRAY